MKKKKPMTNLVEEEEPEGQHELSPPASPLLSKVNLTTTLGKHLFHWQYYYRPNKNFQKCRNCRSILGVYHESDSWRLCPHGKGGQKKLQFWEMTKATNIYFFVLATNIVENHLTFSAVSFLGILQAFWPGAKKKIMCWQNKLLMRHLQKGNLQTGQRQLRSVGWRHPKHSGCVR